MMQEPGGQETGIAQAPAKLLLSLAVLGGGALLLVSFMIPHFKEPFGGRSYCLYVAGATALAGVGARMRGERGTIASWAVVVALMASGLVVLLFAVPLLYGVVMHVAMPD